MMVMRGKSGTEEARRAGNGQGGIGDQLSVSGARSVGKASESLGALIERGKGELTRFSQKRDKSRTVSESVPEEMHSIGCSSRIRPRFGLRALRSHGLQYHRIDTSMYVISVPYGCRASY